MDLDILKSSIRKPLPAGERVVIGMSGGVDSSTAAALLKERGYSVTGLTLKFLCEGCSSGKKNGDEPSLRAKNICDRLGIDHEVIDVSGRFRREVIDHFISSYRAGRTPNPCIICNERVKFPSIASAADSLGIRRVATGHYARLANDSAGRLLISEAADRMKDQGYFLYRVPVSILKRSIFPLAGLKKDQVRSIASSLGLGAKSGKESQDICFIPDGDLRQFLSGHLDPVEGDVVDRTGKVLGRHKGAFNYTIGQRKGLGISSQTPLYVSSIDPCENRVVLSDGGEILGDKVVCSQLRMRVRNPALPLTAKIRYRHRPAAVKEISKIGSRLIVRFRENQRAVTSGQSLVLYSDGMIIGGGIIEGPGDE